MGKCIDCKFLNFLASGSSGRWCFTSMNIFGPSNKEMGFDSHFEQKEEGDCLICKHLQTPRIGLISEYARSKQKI